MNHASVLPLSPGQSVRPCASSGWTWIDSQSRASRNLTSQGKRASAARGRRSRGARLRMSSRSVHARERAARDTTLWCRRMIADFPRFAVGSRRWASSLPSRRPMSRAAPDHGPQKGHESQGEGKIFHEEHRGHDRVRCEASAEGDGTAGGGKPEFSASHSSLYAMPPGPWRSCSWRGFAGCGAAPGRRRPSCAPAPRS